MYKKRIGIIFGGRSAEHDVSLKSAAAVIRNLNSDKFVPVYIGINRRGEWKRFGGSVDLIEKGIWETHAAHLNTEELKDIIDFALPILHGPYGEDGKIQGFLETLGIPYGGCGVLASAVCMDKQMFKDVLPHKGFPVVRSMCLTCQNEPDESVLDKIEGELGFPCFVKPANMGSSVGISKAADRHQLACALRLAASYDSRVVIEEFVQCRELETAVMGNIDPEASEVGEIIPSAEFYDYEAKYSGCGRPSELHIPAGITDGDRRQIRRLAVEAYKAACCSGYARVDFFKDKTTGKIYINEINTIPGFTDKSMFPLLWSSYGVSFPKTIERIIELGYERYHAENNRQAEL